MFIHPQTGEVAFSAEDCAWLAKACRGMIDDATTAEEIQLACLYETNFLLLMTQRIYELNVTPNVEQTVKDEMERETAYAKAG